MSESLYPKKYVFQITNSGSYFQKPDTRYTHGMTNRQGKNTLHLFLLYKCLITCMHVYSLGAGCPQRPKMSLDAANCSVSTGTWIQALSKVENVLYHWDISFPQDLLVIICVFFLFIMKETVRFKWNWPSKTEPHRPVWLNGKAVVSNTFEFMCFIPQCKTNQPTN